MAGSLSSFRSQFKCHQRGCPCAFYLKQPRPSSRLCMLISAPALVSPNNVGIMSVLPKVVAPVLPVLGEPGLWASRGPVPECPVPGHVPSSLQWFLADQGLGHWCTHTPCADLTSCALPWTLWAAALPPLSLLPSSQDPCGRGCVLDRSRREKNVSEDIEYLNNVINNLS